jgi:hypothetical protein
MAIVCICVAALESCTHGIGRFGDGIFMYRLSEERELTVAKPHANKAIA